MALSKLETISSSSRRSRMINLGYLLSFVIFKSVTFISLSKKVSGEWTSKKVIYFFLSLSGIACSTAFTNDTVFPKIMQGDWFSWEEGRGVETQIFQDEIRGRGKPVDRTLIRRDIYEYVFVHQSGCYYCARFFVRSWNIVERLESKSLFQFTSKLFVYLVPLLFWNNMPKM